MRTCGTELSPAPGNPARAGMPRHAQPSRAPVHSPGPPDLPASPRPRMAAALSSLTPALRTPFCRPRRGAAAARHGRQAGRHGDATAATDGAGARTSGGCRTPCCPCRGSCALECPPSLHFSERSLSFFWEKKKHFCGAKPVLFVFTGHFFAGNVNRPRRDSVHGETRSKGQRAATEEARAERRKPWPRLGSAPWARRRLMRLAAPASGACAGKLQEAPRARRRAAAAHTTREGACAKSAGGRASASTSAGGADARSAGGRMSRCRTDWRSSEQVLIAPQLVT